jgi:hypothetical protein
VRYRPGHSRSRHASHLQHSTRSHDWQRSRQLHEADEQQRKTAKAATSSSIREDNTPPFAKGGRTRGSPVSRIPSNCFRQVRQDRRKGVFCVSLEYPVALPRPCTFYLRACRSVCSSLFWASVVRVGFRVGKKGRPDWPRVL